MAFVIEERDEISKLMSEESVNIIKRWNTELLQSVESGSSLKVGEFWNVEILETYIQFAKIECCIFYYREVPGEQKFVLVKTRKNIMCQTKHSNCLVFVELANKHKMLVEQLPGERDCLTHFQKTDFTLPIWYDFPPANYLASFPGQNLFLPVHLARLIQVTHFGACGYKCFSEILGRLVLFFHISLFYFNISYIMRFTFFQVSHGWIY